LKNDENDKRKLFSSIDNIVSSPVNKLSKSYNVNEFSGKLSRKSKIKEDENKNVNEMLLKFELMDKRLKERNQKREREQMLFSEVNMLRQEGFKYNYKKQVNILEFNKERNLQNILDRERRAEEKQKLKLEIYTRNILHY